MRYVLAPISIQNTLDLGQPGFYKYVYTILAIEGPLEALSFQPATSADSDGAAIPAHPRLRLLPKDDAAISLISP